MTVYKFSRHLIGIVTILTLVACSKKDKSDSKKAVQKKAAVVKTFEVPQNVLMYTGTDNPDATLGSLYKIAQQVTPMVPDPRQMVGPLIQGYFRLATPAAIDMKKPLRFVMFDPKGLGRDPSALIVGIKDQKSLATSIGKIDQKTKDRGNEWSYLKSAGAKYPVFVNALKNHMVLTRHPDTFPKNKEFIEALVKESMKGSGVLHGHLSHAFSAFRSDIDKELKRAKKQFKRAGKAKGQPDLTDQASSMLESTVTFAEAIDSVDLRLDLSDDGILLRKTIHPKAGSTLAKSWQGLKTPKHELLNTLPKDTLAVMSVAFSETMNAKLIAMISDLSNALKGALPTPMPFLEPSYIEERFKYTTGHSIGALLSIPDRGGLSGLTLAGITDSAKARELFTKTTENGQASAADANMAKSGIRLDRKKAGFDIKGQPAFTVSIETTDPAVASTIAATGFQKSTTFIGDKVSATVTGAEAKALLTAYFEGKDQSFSQTPSMVRTLKNKAPNTMLLGYINPIKVAKKARLSGMNPFATTLADVKAESGLALSVGHENGQLVSVLDIPTRLLSEAFGVFEKMKGSF